MDGMLQRHCAKHIYVVPDGLKELMSDISREVLRTQPTNIYCFIADYLDALIITRENARVASRLVQHIVEISTTTCDFLKKTGMTRQEADRVVKVIQSNFKKHLRQSPVVYNPEEYIADLEEANVVSNIINEADIPSELGEEAAKIIQSAYKIYKDKREREKEMLNGMIDWRVAARSAIRLYRKTGVTNEEANRAATLIKAAYKGYYTRRVLKRMTQSERAISETLEKPADLVNSDSAVKSEKSVKINYDTVIPHVDFEDVVETNKTVYPIENVKSPLTSRTSDVVSNALNTIFEHTMAVVERVQVHTDNKTDIEEINNFDSYSGTYENEDETTDGLNEGEDTYGSRD